MTRPTCRSWIVAVLPDTRRRLYVRTMEDPERAQREVLDGILRRNVATEFGRSHGFAKMKRVEDLQDAVPPAVAGLRDPEVWRYATPFFC